MKSEAWRKSAASFQFWHISCSLALEESSHICMMWKISWRSALKENIVFFFILLNPSLCWQKTAFCHLCYKIFGSGIAYLLCNTVLDISLRCFIEVLIHSIGIRILDLQLDTPCGLISQLVTTFIPASQTNDAVTSGFCMVPKPNFWFHVSCVNGSWVDDFSAAAECDLLYVILTGSTKRMNLCQALTSAMDIAMHKDSSAGLLFCYYAFVSFLYMQILLR